ncbi:uncharacterized mitochondrial protein-like protein [Tanacetum coccineum]
MTFEQRSSSLVLHQMTSDHNRSELGIHDHSNEPSSSKLVPKVVPLAVKTATSRQELELLFHHHIAMLRTTGEMKFFLWTTDPPVPKSTSGGIQFLGDKLVSWMLKKQNCTTMSSAEAEYVALSASCAQVMWMRTQL